MAMSDRKFLIIMLIISLLARIALAPLYVSEPGQAYSIEPHDFPKYIGIAETILQGNTTYSGATIVNSIPTAYGPLFLLSVAGWI
jgi:hypothetical protein